MSSKMRYSFRVLMSLLIGTSLCSQGDRVRLRDVQVLTLRQGQYTTGRRSHPVPQLNCRGGSAGCRNAPSVVQCYNRGTDGRDVQWECKAEMRKTQKFGMLQVSCEGYDYPEDDYILVGSCGLEYYLERTGYGRGSARNPLSGRRGRREKYRQGNISPVVHGAAAPRLKRATKIASRQHLDSKLRHDYPEYQHQRFGGTHSFWPNVMLVAVSAFVIYAFWLCCMALRQNDARYSYERLPTYDPGYQRHSNLFAQPEYSPVPPPYNPAFMAYPYQSVRGCASIPGFGLPCSSSRDGPGFWTGAASGGLLGYLYGSRNNTSDRTACTSRGEGVVPAATYVPSFFTDDADDEHVSTGFGGTDRRYPVNYGYPSNTTETTPRTFPGESAFPATSLVPSFTDELNDQPASTGFGGTTRR